VVVVHIRVMMDRRIGNIELVCIPVLACSKVPGIETIFDMKKVITSIRILPIIPAIRLPSELIRIF
jgi:hypothetical protein